jgi:hypothetical protein
LADLVGGKPLLCGISAHAAHATSAGDVGRAGGRLLLTLAASRCAGAR